MILYDYKIGEPVRITSSKFPLLKEELGFIKDIHYEGQVPITYIIKMLNQKISYTFNRWDFAPIRTISVKNTTFVPLKLEENDLVRVKQTSKKPSKFHNKLGKIIKVNNPKTSDLPYSVVFPILGEYWFFNESDLELVRKGVKNIRTDLTNNQSFNYSPTPKLENETYTKKLTIKLI